MPKDASYHRSAVYYNEQLAIRAEQLVEELEHEEVQRWANSVGKQHRFHESRHAKALAKIESGGKKVVHTEDGGEDRVVDDEHISVPQPGADADGFGGDAPEPAEAVEEQHIAHSPEGQAVPGEPQFVEDAADPSKTPAPAQAGPPIDEGVDVSETTAQAAKRLEEELNDGKGI